MSDRPEQTLDHYRERFNELAIARRPEEPAWLQRLREEAFEHFASQGFPTTRQEEWRYTSLSELVKRRFELAENARIELSHEAIEELSFPVFACSLYVFVNGRFAPALSTPRALSGALRVESLATLLREAPERLEPHLGRVVACKDKPFAALNTAFMRDGALVSVPRDHAGEQPIHLVFVTTGEADNTLTSPRVLIDAQSGSRALVIQDHVSIGEAVRFTNATCEVAVAANAQLDLVLLQRECDASFHLSQVGARLERDARFASHSLTLGGKLVRNDLEARLEGEGADCSLNGLFLGTGDRLVDNHTLVDHALPHGTSRELYKGILGGASRGVFRGRVVVRPDAQKTDASQSNPNLLLDDRAEIDTKPQLEIYADDVKCSHGSTIGQLDLDALFYLRSRGIGEAQARDLLTQGFAAEITDALPSEPLAERMRELLLDRLHEAEAP